MQFISRVSSTISDFLSVFGSNATKVFAITRQIRPCSDALILLDSLILFPLSAAAPRVPAKIFITPSLHPSTVVENLTISLSLLAYINISCRPPPKLRHHKHGKLLSNKCTHMRDHVGCSSSEPIAISLISSEAIFAPPARTTTISEENGSC